MTQLTQMRTRIKAINTIAKITHAMQLIAMADHIRLRERKKNFERYQEALTELFNQLQLQTLMRTQQAKAMQESSDERPKPEKTLIIIVGSQKGLCGSFNTNLLYEVGKMLKEEYEAQKSTLFNRKGLPHPAHLEPVEGAVETVDLITIGKKLKDYLKSFRQNLPFQTKVVAEHNNFVWANMSTIAQALLDHALDPALGYTKVVLYGHRPEGFFSQRVMATQLLPIREVDITNIEEFTGEEKMGAPAVDMHQQGIGQAPEAILATVKQLYLLSTVEFVLLQSLLTEQATRFVSMDAATRNTKKLRETMQMQFNKLRQAKITKELTELASNV